MIEYKANKGKDPTADPDDFRDLIKKSLHVDFDERKIMDMVRRLVKNYANNVAKKRVLSIHEKNTFGLSKMNNSNAHGDSVEVKLAGPQCFSEDAIFSKEIVGMGFDENFVKKGLKLLESSKRAELEEKWRKVKMAEIELYLKRADLVCEQTKLILDAMKTSEH
ncbi:hypothetical protein Nepgr_000763 [Nepenthes gracilis]|uniref:Uncharacterized protein n=1 Tax=Nepenthes gracilis TaxID=150966 RepID=A0AAD3RWF6_NEPGR|nr:hypothetical protein Nepgr_000763 [Nepenthes gracilis]